uniref:S9 family peptidase n=1 Tax=Coralloluteibacterium stylophorae TaxID=1776034 RepID=A0A8J7VW50_9GAMM
MRRAALLVLLACMGCAVRTPEIRSDAPATAAPQVAPYGSWRSPLSAEQVVAGTVTLGAPMLAGDDVLWLESRPGDARTVLVRARGDGAEDITPAPFSVRSRVHEYGGGAWTVVDDAVLFVNFADQGIYRQPLQPGAQPEPVARHDGLRYADGAWDARHARLIAVREDHRREGVAPANALVAVAMDGGERVLAEGHDFFASPALSADGRELAWLSWDQPQMPWDGTTLWRARLGADGGLEAVRRVAGGPEESVVQPQWAPDGSLVYVSDRSGWWNLYRDAGAGEDAALLPMQAEFGRAQWAFGMSTYAILDDGRIVATAQREDGSALGVLDPRTGAWREFALPWREIEGLRAARGQAVFIGGAPGQAPAVVRLDLADGEGTVLRRSSTLAVDPRDIAVAEPIRFPTGDGEIAHAFHYAPTNARFRGPDGERPPLLVLTHGGPTGSTSPTFNPRVQYWTTRGFAVVDVNYRGSQGFGRAYRRSLDGRWGVADVDDVVAAARFLVARGDVDGERLLIRGGSAGGYTTLAALAFRPGVFAAGASHYGIGDLETLARDTHKFEARYLDGLVAPYDRADPAAMALYAERSPVRHVERITSPLILFQGLEDRVVPPNQAETMYAAVRGRGLPVAYVPFAGEGHGFRQAKNIRRALEAELYFYGRVLGFAPADAIEPVAIENLPPR